jgi:hypothetical protein
MGESFSTLPLYVFRADPTSPSTRGSSTARFAVQANTLLSFPTTQPEHIFCSPVLLQSCLISSSSVFLAMELTQNQLFGVRVVRIHVVEFWKQTHVASIVFVLVLCIYRKRDVASSWAAAGACPMISLSSWVLMGNMIVYLANFLGIMS